MPTGCMQEWCRGVNNIPRLLCFTAIPTPPPPLPCLLLPTSYISLEIREVGLSSWFARVSCKYWGTNDGQFPLPQPSMWLAGSMTMHHFGAVLTVTISSCSQNLGKDRTPWMEIKVSHFGHEVKQPLCITAWRNGHGLQAEATTLLYPQVSHHAETFKEHQAKMGQPRGCTVLGSVLRSGLRQIQLLLPSLLHTFVGNHLATPRTEEEPKEAMTC